MRIFGFCLYALLLAFSAGCAQQAASTAESGNLKGSWDVKLVDTHHKVIATMTVSFTNRDAASCMSGAWKKVAVSNYKTEDADFFPGGEPLAYAFDGDVLTIGRMTVCDGYLMLEGKLVGDSAQGEYSGVSIGGSVPLGYFEARRIP